MMILQVCIFAEMWCDVADYCVGADEARFAGRRVNLHCRPANSRAEVVNEGVGVGGAALEAGFMPHGRSRTSDPKVKSSRTIRGSRRA